MSDNQEKKPKQPSPEEIEAARSKLEKESEARAALRECRKEVNAEAIKAFVANGIDEQTAKMVIGYVALGRIPNMFIIYHPKPKEESNG